MRTCAFFPPRLNPVLNRGKGDEDAMVAPQVPTGRAVGQTVLNNEPHRQIDHAVCVVTAGRRQIREIGIKVLTTLCAVVL
jgi:hypothetical protein